MQEGQNEIEKDILNGIFQNSREAWERFIHGYGKAIHHSIYKTTLKKGIRIPCHDLEDLNQDFLLSLIENDYKKLRSFKFGCSLKTWLIILATNFTLSWANKTINHPLPQPFGEEFEKIIKIIPDPRSCPGEHLTEKEIENLIQDFQKGLDPLSKDIFNLHFREGKTPKEIISIKGIPQATAYRKIHELKKAFLDLLQQ